MSDNSLAVTRGRREGLNLFWVGVAVAAVYWLLESTVHFFFFQSQHGHSVMQALVAMNDANEFIMRLVIVALMVSFGLVAENMRRKERRYRLREEKINRLLLFLREIFHGSQRCKSMQPLLEAACKSAVDDAGARCAWIGMMKDGVLELAAWSSPDPLIDAEVERLKKPVHLECCKVTTDVLNHEGAIQCRLGERADCSAPWVQVFLEQGCSQAVAMPLIVDRDVVGVFEIFFAEDEMYGGDEIAILEEAASDVSMALSEMKHEGKRKREEEDMRRHIDELERFQRATVQREFRIKELREEIKLLQAKKEVNPDGSELP